MTTTTTLNAIRDKKPCTNGWRRLLTHLGKTSPDDEPLPLTVILDSNGLDDCLWCLRCLGPEHDGWIRQFARESASDVLHLWNAPQVVRDYLATGNKELRAAAGEAAGAAAREAARAEARAKQAARLRAYLESAP